MKQEFPRSARDALARQTAADEHPSADLLNGFLERALGADENARVTAHLASCADCRDVVFFAGAANPEEQPAASASAASVPAFWARWGTWKWLVPTMAALAIVSGVVIERHSSLTARAPAHATVAMNAPSPGPSMQARDATANELNPTASEYSSIVKKEQLKKTDGASRTAQQSKTRTPLSDHTDSKDQNRTELGQAAPQPPPLGGPQGGAWPTTPPRAVAKTAAPGPVPPPPQSGASPARPQSQTAEVTSVAPLVQADQMQAETKAGGAAAKAITRPDGTPMQAPADAAAVTGQPVAAVASSSLGASKRKASGIGGNSLSLAKQAVAPHWRISTDGHLERSTASNEWTPVLAEQPVAFRAVAVIGNDVWAGGSGGALFHSSDAGEHWMQVALIADGRPEGEAVESIRFDTSASGRVTTAGGATWSTQDGGKTWTRQ